MSNVIEQLILVDETDRAIGEAEKKACHLGSGKLHRAFSIFIFNSRNELLIQKRSNKKMLWPDFWSNSCCSHPRKGESLDEALQRRLMQELKIKFVMFSLEGPMSSPCLIQMKSVLLSMFHFKRFQNELKTILMILRPGLK
jgi:isopentenyldiphosphate isomerase